MTVVTGSSGLSSRGCPPGVHTQGNPTGVVVSRLTHVTKLLCWCCIFNFLKIMNVWDFRCILRSYGGVGWGCVCLQFLVFVSLFHP